MKLKANTAVTALLLICAAVLPSGCNRYDPYNPDTANLEGVWALDNNIERKADEPPVLKSLTIYATHMEFCPGQGTVGTLGHWRGDGFWCEIKGSLGEFEAAKVVSSDTIELHLGAFYPGNAEVLTLYKQRGSDDEMKARAAKYPQPVSYPPPQGAITVGMTEYELNTLPWKPDKVMALDGTDQANAAQGHPFYIDADDDASIYCYHSDNPHLVELRVTVKNHRVIGIGGGNG